MHIHVSLGDRTCVGENIEMTTKGNHYLEFEHGICSTLSEVEQQASISFTASTNVRV